MLHKITYSHGVTQVKNLIPHALYVAMRAEQDALIALTPKDKRTKDDDKKLEADLKRIDKEFKAKYGDEYFTDESPLGKAIATGLLVLPEHQGGTTNCLVISC